LVIYSLFRDLDTISNLSNVTDGEDGRGKLHTAGAGRQMIDPEQPAPGMAPASLPKLLHFAKSCNKCEVDLTYAIAVLEYSNDVIH